MEFNKKVYMAATAYTLITGLAFLFVKIALTSADPFDLLAYRFTVAFIAILVAYAFKKVKIDYSIERIKKIIPLALIYPLSFFTFQTFGLQYTSSAEAGILMASSPVFTLLLATYFIKEKTTFYQKLSILLSVAGVIYITVNKSTGLNFNSILGVILILLTALSIAGYNVMARIYTRDFTSIELSSIMIFISFIGYNLISIIKHLIKGTLSSFLLL